MNPKEKDNEIIELTDEKLDEIFADDDFDNGEEDGKIRSEDGKIRSEDGKIRSEDGKIRSEDGKIRSFYFSNPDPYAKVKPRPDDAPKREFSFDEKGNIVVKNPSAFWLPDVKIVEEHGSTEYTVTGSYEGTETLSRASARSCLRWRCRGAWLPFQHEETVADPHKRCKQILSLVFPPVKFTRLFAVLCRGPLFCKTKRPALNPDA